MSDDSQLGTVNLNKEANTAKANFNGSPAKIKIIGLGGSGGNTVTRMVREEIRGAEFIIMNTDSQSLALSEAPIRIQLGRTLTKGLGAGGDYVLGRRASEESRDEIAEVISGADLVFITCGMGGGTGTGAASFVAEIARKSGILTIAVVSKPFTFEGRHRCEVAEIGIIDLFRKVDTLIIIPNDRLLALCDQNVGVDEAFRMADDVLKKSILAITEVLNTPGIINLDFADIRAIMKDAGPAWTSIGLGSGPGRAVKAAQSALASPLLDVSINGATGVLFNIVGNNLTLYEIDEAAELIKKAVDHEANIIFGVAIDPNMDEKEIKITLIATGFVDKNKLTSGRDNAELAKLLTSSKQNGNMLDIPPSLNDHKLSQQLQD